MKTEAKIIECSYRDPKGIYWAEPINVSNGVSPSFEMMDGSYTYIYGISNHTPNFFRTYVQGKPEGEEVIYNYKNSDHR